jgi:broad specificity phosphatase PhoE
MEGFRGTAILIRHADVTPEPGGAPDPGPRLNAAGQARARELRHVLRDAGVRAIFVTRLRRSQQTAEPLAMKLGIVPRVIDEVDEVVTAIRSLPAASVTLVIGHSNTVPEIIAKLGGPLLPTLAATEFDNLFVQSGQRLTHLRYGA